METVALGITAPVASFTVPEMRPPTPARAASARINRAARSEMARLKERGGGRNMSLLVANHYQLEKESRLVAIGCQLENCKNLVTNPPGGICILPGIAAKCRSLGRRFRLEVETDLRGQGARRDVVRAAEGGEKIVNRFFVADVNGGQAETPLVAVAAEKIVVAESQVEQVAGSDTRRIVVVVLSSGSGNLQELRIILRRGAGAGGDDRRAGGIGRARRRGENARAREAGLKLLIGRKAGDVHKSGDLRAGAIAAVAGDWPRDQTAVVAPVETNPGPEFFRLVLQVRGLVEVLVVVNAEGSEASRDDGNRSDAADLRSEETRGDAGHHHQRGEAVEIRDVSAKGVAGDFGIVPLDGESDGRRAEDAEVVAIVRVLPDVLAVNHQIFSEGLLQAGVKFVAKAGSERGGGAGCAAFVFGGEKGADDGVEAAEAGEDQVFVERSLQGAGVGSAQNGVGFFDVVGNTEARLGLRAVGQAFIDIAADAEVERPIFQSDGILHVHGELLHVRVARETILGGGGLARGAAVARRQRGGAGQVVAAEQRDKRADCPLAEIGLERAGALRLRGDAWICVGRAVGIQAHGV